MSVHPLTTTSPPEALKSFSTSTAASPESPIFRTMTSAAPPWFSGDSDESVMMKGKKIIRTSAAKFIALLMRSASFRSDARSAAGVPSTRDLPAVTVAVTFVVTLEVTLVGSPCRPRSASPEFASGFVPVTISRPPWSVRAW